MARHTHQDLSSRRSLAGFTYLWVLLCVAVISVGLVVASEVWVLSAQRERREQQEWVGQQFVQAIGSYHDGGPAGLYAYPTSLEQLLEDRRFAVPRRHLRRIYLDPFTGAANWEPVNCGGRGICGVRSTAALPSPPTEYVWNRRNFQ